MLGFDEHVESLDSPKLPHLDMSALAPFRAEIARTMGAAYVGVAVSSTLYGMTCIQAFYYFRSSHKDSWQIPALVVVLWALDTLHQAFTNHAIYHYLVAEYGNPLALLRVIWSIPAGLLVNAIVSGLVDIFLLWRLWSLSKNRWYTGFCGAWVIVHIGMHMTAAIRPFISHSAQPTLLKLKNEAISGLAVDIVLDLFLAAGLVYCLHHQRTGFHKSGDVITKLIVLTVSTGLLTTLFVIAEMLSFILAPTSLFGLFFNFLVGKLYINTFLTSLNYRDNLKARLTNDSESNSYSTPRFQHDSLAVMPAPLRHVAHAHHAHVFGRPQSMSGNTWRDDKCLDGQKMGDERVRIRRETWLA